MQFHRRRVLLVESSRIVLAKRLLDRKRASILDESTPELTQRSVGLGLQHPHHPLLENPAELRRVRRLVPRGPEGLAGQPTRRRTALRRVLLARLLRLDRDAGAALTRAARRSHGTTPAPSSSSTLRARLHRRRCRLAACCASERNRRTRGPAQSCRFAIVRDVPGPGRIEHPALSMSRPIEPAMCAPSTTVHCTVRAVLQWALYCPDCQSATM